MHDQCILLIQIADTSIFNMMNNKTIVMYVFLDADVLCSLKVDLNQRFKWKISFEKWHFYMILGQSVWSLNVLLVFMYCVGFISLIWYQNNYISLLSRVKLNSLTHTILTVTNSYSGLCYHWIERAHTYKVKLWRSFNFYCGLSSITYDLQKNLIEHFVERGI